MKNVKRIAVAAIVFVVLGVGNASANYPVIDLANLTESIEQVYQQYMDIQQMIQSVQNQYILIQRSIDNVKNMSFDKFKSLGDPSTWTNPEVLHDAYQAAIKQANQNMNTIRSVQNRIKAKHIKVGNMEISPLDFIGTNNFDEYGTDGDAVHVFSYMKDRAVERQKKVAQAWTDNLTWEEKNAIMQKYGMSPRNYAETVVASDVAIGIIKGTIEAAKEEGSTPTPTAAEELTPEYKEEKNNEVETKASIKTKILEEINKDAAESTIAQQSLMNSTLIDVSKSIDKTHNAIQNLRAEIEHQYEREAEQKEIERAMKQRAEIQAYWSLYPSSSNTEECLSTF